MLSHNPSLFSLRFFRHVYPKINGVKRGVEVTGEIKVHPGVTSERVALVSDNGFDSLDRLQR